MTTTIDAPTHTPTRRGTTNGNQRGSSYARRSRRAWLVLTYQSNVQGMCRCYRCGVLLYNPDTWQLQPPVEFILKYGTQVWAAQPLTVDRILPGCKGGTYRRNNIRPACGGCNSETGGALSGHGSKA